MYDSSLVKEKVLRVHPDFDDVVRFAQGKYPDYDWELIERIGQELGKEPPAEKLDI